MNQNVNVNVNAPSLSVALEEIVGRYGIMRLVLALPQAVVSARNLKSESRLEFLDDRLREDMGLPPLKRDRVPEALEIWMLRF